jgi:hypothetical protein
MSFLVLRKCYCDTSNNFQRLYTVVTVCCYEWDDTDSEEVAVSSDNEQWTELWSAVYLLPTKKFQTSHKVPCIVRYVSYQILLTIKIVGSYDAMQ